MKAKTRNFISVFINLFLIVSTIFAYRDEVWSCLTMFTHLSNWFTVLTSLIMLVIAFIRVVNKGKKNLPAEMPSWLSNMRLIAAVCMMLTFVMVAGFLSLKDALAGKNYFRRFSGPLFHMHFFSPLLMIVSFLCIDPDGKKKLSPFMAVIPVIAYGVVYVIEVIILENWRDIYGFTFGGNMLLSACMFIAVSLVAFGIAVVLLAARKKIRK